MHQGIPPAAASPPSLIVRIDQYFHMLADAARVPISAGALLQVLYCLVTSVLHIGGTSSSQRAESVPGRGEYIAT